MSDFEKPWFGPDCEYIHIRIGRWINYYHELTHEQFLSNLSKIKLTKEQEKEVCEYLDTHTELEYTVLRLIDSKLHFSQHDSLLCVQIFIYQWRNKEAHHE